ncbi:MAG: antibiotic ABC transporter permease, partial [Finegoldia magna]|nr:antibiotic ABC transporter permease [Finegoldia magna]
LSISFMYSVFIGLFPMNLQSIIVSLDGQNHDYLMSLPMSKKTYLNEKVKFSFTIMGVLSALAILGFSIFFRVKVYFIILAILLNLISIFVFCRFKVAGDYKHKYVNWSSISDIMNRQSKFAYVIKMMGLSFLTIAIFSFVMFSIQSAPIKWILMGISIPWALIVIGIELYNRLGFWRKIK